MKKTRMVILTQALLVLGLNLLIAPTAYAQAKASITKVGNGDDGADLEGLSPITSGPIVEARKRALKLLDKLNIVGVPGLGMLVPELEKTDLMMAAIDVHPTGEKKGSLEISEDQKVVYARTFATPSAATRFFPAAKKLSSDQLVALQIHEALHRSLPANIRENENIVMHFTLAITSPGASFDRVQEVSKIYFRPDFEPEEVSQPKVTVILPPASPTYLGYQFNSYSGSKDGISGTPYTAGILELNSSLGGYHAWFGRAIEPAFRARLMVNQGFAEKNDLGPVSFDLEARVKTEEGVIGPFVRYTTKPLDGAGDNGAPVDEREVTTLGGFFRGAGEHSYIDATLGYSLSSSTSSNYYSPATKYSPIISVGSHFGFKWEHAKLGGIAEYYTSDGREDNSYYGSDTPRFLILGPEVAFTTQLFELKFYYKKIVNENSAWMDDLADVMDHGYGRGGFGASVMFNW